MRRLVREWQSLGTAGFIKARQLKAQNKLRAGYHQLRKTPLVPSRYGVNMVPNWQDTTFRFCIDGAYGYELHDLLTQFNEPFTFLDIGANQGLYSLIAATNPACHSIFSFEPMPQTFEYLTRNIAANQCASIKPINAAISDHSGTATLTVNPNHTGGASLQEVDGTDMERVSIQTLDHRALNDLVTPVGKIVVKVDVEGHEETVFRQLALCDFANALHTIHYEVDEHWVDPQRLHRVLSDIGISDFTRIDSQRSHHYDMIARRSILPDRQHN
jgi:FkbM family methyltransferase